MLISHFCLQHTISLYSQNWILNFKKITKIICFLDFQQQCQRPNKQNCIKVLSEYKLEIQNSIHNQSNRWNQNVIYFLAKPKKIVFSKMCTLYIEYICAYVCMCICVSNSLKPHGFWPTGSSVHGRSRQGSWSGLPFSTPEDFSDTGI